MLSDVIWGAIAAILAIMGYLMGCVHGEVNERERWKVHAIERNVARYHPQTGKFEWTVENTNEPMVSE